MASRVLWEIDSELSGHTFERLCIDLLHRNGYLDIVPIEPQDGGRDAEEIPRHGRSSQGHPAFFQFSLESDWKAKLRRDAKKLEPRRSDFDTLVFVTSQSARGIDVDALHKEFRERFGWNLFVYGREWLRFQLEEKHPDIALRHLGVKSSPHFAESAVVLGLSDPLDEQLKAVKVAVDAEDFDFAIALLKKFLLNHPDSQEGRLLLAWSLYRQDGFDEALAAINRARRLGDSAQTASIKACILVEKGIKERDKPSLSSALELLKELLEEPRAHSWQLFYNLGNVLGALQRHKEAIAYYRAGVALDPKQPTLWKNLASALHAVGEHEEEMKCFDNALELDPQQPEALISKAISLLTDFDKPDEAEPLFQFVMRVSPDSISKWPQVLFWYALAQDKVGNPQEALSLIEESLEQQPGDHASRHLKSVILGKLFSQNPDFEDRALSYWEDELMLEPRNYLVREQLVKALLMKVPEEGWKRIDESFAVLDLNPAAPLRDLLVDPLDALRALEFLPQYRLLRQIQPLSAYWDQDDPLNFGLAFPGNEQLLSRFTSYFAIAFGKAWRAFSEHPQAKSDAETLAALFDGLRSDVLTAVTQASRCLGEGIGALKTDVEAMSSSFANAIVFLNTVALREFGAERGFLMREFEIDDAVKEMTMDNYDENQLNLEVLGAVATAINDGARLFRALKGHP
jgi:tetratricopeptide (TPR) repeat protein